VIGRTELSATDDVTTRRDATASAVSLASASVSIGGRTIWADVNLQIASGHFVAVLGPNGAGKSTLVQVILGLRRLDSGDIRVFGEGPGMHNRDIGYLPQRRAFDASTRIRGVDVVRLGWDGDRWGVPLPAWVRRRSARESGERVAEVIELVGAQSYAHRPIGQCSGGEQQRLLIAQALVRQPRLLLLDEPLDSLDVTNQASMSALIQDVCRVQNIAVVLVAHDVNPILQYLDEVVYLGHGRALIGSPAEVITADTLTALYGTPIDVLRDRFGRLVVVGQPDVAGTHDHHR
jgi:zinc/manganese transport system ATP-binding protein